MKEKLNNIGSTKAYFRTFSITQLERIIEVATIIMDEKNVKVEEAMEMLKKKENALTVVKATLENKGISYNIKTLCESLDLTPPKTKYTPRGKNKNTNPRKYCVVDSNRQFRFWSGNGTMPKQFTQVILKLGIPKSAFLAEYNLVVGFPFDSLKGCEAPSEYN